MNSWESWSNSPENNYLYIVLSYGYDVSIKCQFNTAKWNNIIGTIEYSVFWVGI